MEQSLSDSFSGDFSCAVCRDVFKHPVLLLCSHSFCRACLREWWTHKDMRECPVCKNVSSMDDPPCNLALKNLCETFVQERRRKMDPREAAEESLELLREKLKVFARAKAGCDQTAEHIGAQARNTERRIHERFEDLHRYLREEEEARIAALREEESRKSQAMREKVEGLEREMATLAGAVHALEEELRAGRTVTPAHRAAAERVQAALRDPLPVPAGALIDEAGHLGNLAHRVWDKMRDPATAGAGAGVAYSPVVLDPNTAHPRLVLSDDLTAVRRGLTDQRLPDNPERFDVCCRVLAARGLSGSGTHTWDVEVGDNAYWAVGVLAAESSSSSSCSASPRARKGRRAAGAQYWKVSLCDGRYAAYAAKPRGNGGAPHPTACIQVKQKPRRVRVHLDWSRGRLTFSDPDAGALLHAFQHTFTDALYPYVHNGDDAGVPLRVLPRRVSTAVLGEDDTGSAGARVASSSSSSSLSSGGRHAAPTSLSALSPGRPPSLPAARPFRP